MKRRPTISTSDNRPRERRRAFIAAVVAVSFVTAACSGGTDGATKSPDPVTSTAAQSGAPPEPSTDAVTIGCASVPRGMTEFVLDAGGAEHDVRIYMPSAISEESQLPLVMNFHGLGSNGDQQAAFTGYEVLAEQEGFIVVHPTGVPSSTDDQRRNSWETLSMDDQGKDDFVFVHELLDLLIEDYCVDASRVYATGMSGGGLFTSQLVCAMSDRIAAAVSVAALHFSESCKPDAGVPFMAIHGTDDPTVPFDGDFTGTRFEGESFAELLFSTPIPDQFAQFAAVMGCEPKGERAKTSTDIVTTTYTGCDDGVPLVFHKIVGGGHAWPSSPLTQPGSPLADQLRQLQGYSTFDIDATGDGWAFFEQHARAG